MFCGFVISYGNYSLKTVTQPFYVNMVTLSDNYFENLIDRQNIKILISFEYNVQYSELKSRICMCIDFFYFFFITINKNSFEHFGKQNEFMWRTPIVYVNLIANIYVTCRVV